MKKSICSLIVMVGMLFSINSFADPVTFKYTKVTLEVGVITRSTPDEVVPDSWGPGVSYFVYDYSGYDVAAVNSKAIWMNPGTYVSKKWYLNTSSGWKDDGQRYIDPDDNNDGIENDLLFYTNTRGTTLSMPCGSGLLGYQQLFVKKTNQLYDWYKLTFVVKGLSACPPIV